jgi:hypothetical protein
MVLFVEWSVKIDGLDCTAGFNPYVMEIEVEDKAGSESDTARVTLNDADGAIIIPRKGASIEIDILGEPTFKGTTETPRSTGSRGGGMLMTLSAKGFDPEKGAKEGRHFHKDDATLDDYLKDFGSGRASARSRSIPTSARSSACGGGRTGARSCTRRSAWPTSWARRSRCRATRRCSRSRATGRRPPAGRCRPSSRGGPAT